MVSGEARKGPWSVFTDLIYLDFSNEDSAVRSIDFGGPLVTSSVNAKTRSSVSGLAWTLATSYTVWQTPTAHLDAFGGFRYFDLQASTEWQLAATVSGPGGGSQTFPASGRISKDNPLWDALIGVRGRARLGAGNWHVPYYLDIGAGSSDLTWQAYTGLAYDFSWGTLSLIYRHIAYDQSSDKLLQDMEFSGPAIGATFRF